MTTPSVSEEMIRAASQWFDENFNGLPDTKALVSGVLNAALPHLSAHLPAGSEAVKPLEWEMFCDESYFHMWCVRPKESREFGDGFHVPSKAEATALLALISPAPPSTPPAANVQDEPEFKPAIIRNEGARFTEMVFSDEPTVVGLPMEVEPLLSVDGRDIIGFRWYDEGLRSLEAKESER